MKRYAVIYLVTMILFCGNISYSQIFVDTEGNDTNSGAINEPYATIQKAFSVVEPGDTVFIRGGIYEISVPVDATIDGTENAMINVFAYNNENVILDFSGQPYSSSSRAIKLKRKYWHLKGLVIRNAGDNGIHISSDYNVAENCSLYGNKDTGIQISNGGGHNQIINCDSFNNYDPNSHGENADGFAAKLDIGPGNVFRGCRAWGNSDDGWDLYEGQNPVIIDSCWSFRNGINIWNDSNYQGDGNGFKVGGNYVPAEHIVTNSVAFGNVGKGFDQNHNTEGVILYNNTAYQNGRNFVFYETPNIGVHILKNNLSYIGESQIAGNSDESSNTWDGFTITDFDFASLDTTLANSARDENGFLQSTKLFALAAGSSLINAGTDVGISFIGSNPDIGAFEYNGTVGIASENNTPENFRLFQNYPNPFNGFTIIKFIVPQNENVKITIFNINGQLIETILNSTLNAGEHSIQFNSGNLSSGIYFYRIETNSFTNVKQMLLLK